MSKGRLQEVVLKIVQVTMKLDPFSACRHLCRVYIHLSFTYSAGPSSVVWTELGLAPPFPPMRVLEVKWSRALSHVCEVALSRTPIGIQTASSRTHLIYPVSKSNFWKSSTRQLGCLLKHLAWQHGCLPLTYMNTRSNTTINCQPRREVRIKNPMISSLLEMVVPIALIVVQEGCKNVLRRAPTLANHNGYWGPIR